MSGPPYKVKAIYSYKSEHDDDLNFPEGQIITVTEEEDDDWLNGEYKDESGQKQGLFPKNFVERFEPVTPPRPARTTQQRQPTEPVPIPSQQANAPAPEATREPETEQEEEPEEDEDAQTQEQPLAPAPVQATKPPPPPRENVVLPPAQASKPVPPPAQPAAETKAQSPPTPDKPSASSFKDRIAAFNRSGASAPQAPPKPGGLGGGSGSGSFIKKTYMAPPPARNAFVPPVNQAPVAKTYRRDEDPEFTKAPSAESDTSVANKAEEPEEEQPKPLSLKERMALLQQQQLEQQARHSDAASKKAKPKPPPKKAAAPPPQPRASTDEASSGAEMARGASQASSSLPERPALPTRVLSNESAEHVASPEQQDPTERLAPPADEAAEKSASETGETETEEEPAEQGETSDVDEEEDEDDMDPEVRRRMEIRERMAKMSGGMGMGAMFGAPAMPGTGPRKPSRTKSTHSGHGENSDLAASPPQAIPIMPGMGLPGMALPGMGLPRPKKAEQPAETEVVKEGEEDTEVISQTRRPEEVPDIEDVKEQMSEEEDVATQPARAIPARRESRPPTELPSSPQIAPPVPSGSRPPPALPVETRPSLEESDVVPTSPVDRAAPPVPRAARNEERVAPSLPPQVGSPPLPPTSPPMTTSEKRASRAPPPVPGAIDTSVGSTRGPPAPPSQPPRARQSIDVSRAPPPVPSVTSPNIDSDYDPYNYESNPLGVPTPTRGTTPMSDNETDPFPPPRAMDQDVHDTSALGPQSPTTRAPPPPPPHAIAPRAVPPPVPAPAIQYEDSEEEAESENEDVVAVQNPASGSHTEELHHAGLPSLGPQSRAPPPPPPGQAPVSPQIHQTRYSEPPSATVPRGIPPPPPQTVVQEPPIQAASSPRPTEPTPRKSYDGRKSLDVLGGSYNRRSVDVPRPSTDVGDFIAASDIDLGRGSGWWTQRRAAPPVLQGRADVLIDFEESTTMQDVVFVTKHVYVLFMDYSQTIVTARFADGGSDVDLQQRHEPPPARLRQDQLEASHGKIGTRLAATAKNKENQVVGDGTAVALVHELLRSFPEALTPVGTRAFGALVYANIGNASVQQHDEIRPGDIVSFRNAKLQGHRGGLKQKYSVDLAEHVGVVVDWDGTKKKVRAWEQGRESKKVKIESFKLGDLRSGEVKIWRVMSKDWVGWGSI